MGELPRNIREFMVRDLIYIVGGGMVLTSFLYRFDRLPDGDTPVAFYLLAAGVAYVVGSTLQDVFSIFRLVTTAPVLRMRKPWRCIYYWFTNDHWKDIDKYNRVLAERALRNLRRKDHSYAASYERLVSGLILAATMAPCTLVSGLFVSWRWWEYQNGFDFYLGAMAFILSVGLFVLARIRAAQMGRTDADAPEEDGATTAQVDAGNATQKV